MVYPGEEAFPLSREVEALSLPALAKLLAE